MNRSPWSWTRPPPDALAAVHTLGFTGDLVVAWAAAGGVWLWIWSRQGLWLWIWLRHGRRPGVCGASAVCTGFEQAFCVHVEVGFVFYFVALVSVFVDVCLISDLHYRIVNPLS